MAERVKLGRNAATGLSCGADDKNGFVRHGSFPLVAVDPKGIGNEARARIDRRCQHLDRRRQIAITR